LQKSIKVVSKMSSDKADEFVFQRNTSLTGTNRSNRSEGRSYHCRRKLQDTFDATDTASCCDTSDRQNRSILSVLSLNDTKKIFKQSAERISKTFTTVRTSFGSFTQKFRMPTKRRQILEEGPMTPVCETPQARAVLGRTPTKLYSPFAIETPQRSNCDKENILR